MRRHFDDALAVVLAVLTIVFVVLTIQHVWGW